MPPVIPVAIQTQVDRLRLQDTERRMNNFADRTGDRFDRLGLRVAAVGRGLSAIGPLLGAGLGFGAFQGLEQITGAADELQRLSDIAGVSVEDFQSLSKAGVQFGIDGDDMADVLRELQLRLGEAAAAGSGPAVEAMELLGLSWDDLEGKSPREQLILIAEALLGVEDQSQRLFIAEELLGGSFERLQPIILGGDKALRAFIQAEKDATVATDEQVESLVEARRALTEFLGDAETLGIRVLGALAGSMLSVEDRAISLGEELGVNEDLIRELIDTTDTSTRSNELHSTGVGFLDQALLTLGQRLGLGDQLLRIFSDSTDKNTAALIVQEAQLLENTTGVESLQYHMGVLSDEQLRNTRLLNRAIIVARDHEVAAGLQEDQLNLLSLATLELSNDTGQFVQRGYAAVLPFYNDWRGRATDVELALFDLNAELRNTITLANVFDRRSAALNLRVAELTQSINRVQVHGGQALATLDAQFQATVRAAREAQQVTDDARTRSLVESISRRPVRRPFIQPRVQRQRDILPPNQQFPLNVGPLVNTGTTQTGNRQVTSTGTTIIINGDVIPPREQQILGDAIVNLRNQGRLP